MADGNRFGDLEVTDPRMMRALAHPVRLALLDHLQRSGPATASTLSPLVGATPSVTSWHLRHLAGFGLVRDAQAGPDRRERRWEAVARGFRFETPASGEGSEAARALSAELFARAAQLPERWLADAEPDLEPEWRQVAGVSSTRLQVSVEQLAQIEDAIETILAPHLASRSTAEDEGRSVQLVRYVLPASGKDDDAR